MQSKPFETIKEGQIIYLYVTRFLVCIRTEDNMNSPRWSTTEDHIIKSIIVNVSHFCYVKKPCAPHLSSHEALIVSPFSIIIQGHAVE